MELFFSWLSRLFDSWKFWVVIAPWEIGVRVRFGKNAKTMKSGFHFRIPFVDVITHVNTRMRVDGTPPITVKGKQPHCTRYISAIIGYYISDPLKSMLKFGLPSAIVVSKAQGEIATEQDEIKAIESLRKFFNSESGITIDFIKFVEDVEVRTYRLINAIPWSSSGHEMGQTTTVGGRY